MKTSTYKAAVYIAVFCAVSLLTAKVLLFIGKTENINDVYFCQELYNTSYSESPYRLTTKKVSSSMKLTCLAVLGKRICFEQSPPPEENSREVWPEFIGIGPARSGSSALLWMLMKHPHIQVGDPSLQNESCCAGSELYFFNRDHLFIKGLEYYKGFFEPRKPNVKIVGEKTPKYSSHPLVPYRIRALLGPKVKLLFTLRDPFDALLSLYRIRHGKDNSESVSDYFRNLLRSQKTYDDCVQDALNYVQYLSGHKPKKLHETLGQIDWHAAMLLDEAALNCYRDPHLVRLGLDEGELENLQHYIYTENILRWHAVFSKEQVICIWNDELRTRVVDTINEVLRFLGLDPMLSNFTSVSFENTKTKSK